jgi:hypothetical protein
VVGAPAEPLAETAGLAAARAVSLLGVEPLTLGLVLCEGADEVERHGLGDLCAAFSGPCYLASPVDEAGLTLDDAPTLHEQAARFLALYTCTPLRDAPGAADRGHGWDEGRGFASFGLTFLAWPGSVAQARAARWMAEETLPLLLGQAGATADADALLREASLAPPLLAPRLTPPAAADAARLAGDAGITPRPWMLLRPPGQTEHPLMTSIEAAWTKWDAAMASCGPAWERSMQDGITENGASLRTWIAEALDAGGVSEARALAADLERRLGEWAAGAEQRGQECRDDLPRLEEEAQAVRAELAALLDEMPRRRLHDLLRLLRSPLRWIKLWVHWRRLQGLVARYALCRAGALETRLNAEQLARACGVYWALGSDLQSAAGELEQLEQGLRDLHAAPGDLPPWPDEPLLLGDDPDPLLQRLAERHLPGADALAEAFLADLGPPSAWWLDGLPEKDTVDDWWARRAAPLARVPVWEVIRCRQKETEAVYAWLGEMTAQASPLWQWDPAALSDGERARAGCTTMLLSAPAGGAPTDEGLADALASQGTNLRTLPAPRDDWLAVVSLRRGIPAGEPAAAQEDVEEVQG